MSVASNRYTQLGSVAEKVFTSNQLQNELVNSGELVCARKSGCASRKPKKPPTLNEVLRLIARLGGFLGRKSDGEPGVKTIWRGLDQVKTAAETLRALRELE